MLLRLPILKPRFFGLISGRWTERIARLKERIRFNMTDIIPPNGGINVRNIEVKMKTIKPGITKISFKTFLDMGQYYESRMLEFEAKGVRIVTVGVSMYLFEKR